MPPKQRKLAMLGYRSVGKSSLTNLFLENKFGESYDPTIENTFTKTIRIQGQEFEVKILDTAGHDEYTQLPAQYSMDIHGFILVYSINSHKSFEIVQMIYEKLSDISGRVTAPVILVGNKSDLQSDRIISTEEGRRCADAWHACFLETSAKQNRSVNDIFHTVLNEIERVNSNTSDKSNCIIS